LLILNISIGDKNLTIGDKIFTFKLIEFSKLPSSRSGLKKSCSEHKTIVFKGLLIPINTKGDTINA